MTIQIPLVFIYTQFVVCRLSEIHLDTTSREDSIFKSVFSETMGLKTRAFSEKNSMKNQVFLTRHLNQNKKGFYGTSHKLSWRFLRWLRQLRGF
jgi:hypothetical protein